MINLSKKRIAIYLYFTLVFSLIFGLSFTVQGEKISGAFVVEITSNIIEKVSLLSLTLIIFVFLFALAFSLFVIRYAQESGHIHHTNVKKIVAIVIALKIIALLSIGVYFGSGGDKITGAIVIPKVAIAIPEGISKPPSDTPTQSTSRLVSQTSSSTPSSEIIAISKFKSEGSKYIQFYDKGSKKVFFQEVDADGNPIGNPIEERDDRYSDLFVTEFANAQIVRNTAKLLQDSAFLLFGDLLNEQVEAICKEERKSSEPFSSNPTFTNPGPLGTTTSFQSFFVSQTEVNCQNSLTTVTAQARKTQTGQSFDYETSFTITACKQSVSFNIFLENEQDINFNVADGITNLGSTSSETRVFSNVENFNIICVDTSDPAVGSNGLVCFSVVEN